MTTLTARPLEECLTHLPLFYDHIDSILDSRGVRDRIAPILDPKATLAGTPSVDGVMLFNEAQSPVGLGWIERVTPHYGNMIFHALTPHAKPLLAQTIYKKGWLLDFFAELIQFEDDLSPYQDTLLKLGAHENARQRMIRTMDTFSPYPAIKSSDISFKPVTIADIKISSTISYFAHQISRDYAGYPELENLAKRIELEQKVFNRLYGPIIPEASLFILDKKEIVGFCMMVEIPCWGYAKVPWFFDVCIRPDYLGKGYGKKLVQHVLNVLHGMHYEAVGLAVTLTNDSAMGLYHSLGFEIAEYFYEYAQLSKPIS